MKTPKGQRQGSLFDVGPPVQPRELVRRPRHPVWTENKARLIQTYLRLFVLITKHGNYVDAFAGPQEPDKPDMWAAKLVLESRPRWLRKFFLFEIEPDKIRQLEELRDAQAPRDRRKKEPKRTVEIFPGDVNVNISHLLSSKKIRQKEATFCLLDQRTFECQWATVKKVATYKRGDEHKIEIFYFLPNSWLDRAFSGLKDDSKARDWWGGDDWQQLLKLKGHARAAAFSERFRCELGYKSVQPWPIYEKKGGGKTMYFMIHATDHPAAPGLMSRAYRRAVLTDAEFEQLALELRLNPPEN